MKDSVAKLSDFGLAIKIEESTVTQNDIAGSLGYMSPEMLSQQTIGKATDVWSLAVCFYVLIERKFPFNGNGEAEIKQAILTAQPVPFQKQIHFQIRDLILEMLDKNQVSRITIDQILQHSLFDLCRTQQVHSNIIRPHNSQFISLSSRETVP
jgi:serine/threonine protein kinase